jgi:hypothetical protein
MSRFDYVKYDDRAAARQNKLKKMVQELDQEIASIGQDIMGALGGQMNRSKALAITKLEEFYMWVGKAIRDEQIARNGMAELQEERKDG